MAKRLLLILIFCLLSSSICQAAYISATDVIFPCPCILIEDGLYLGGGLGHDAYRIRQGISQFLVDNTLINTNPILDASGLYGNVFGGYGRFFDWFYIAGEIFVGFSDADEHFNINGYSSSLYLRSSYGASILPGVMVNHLGLLYMRVGYIRTFFQYSETGGRIGDLRRTEWGNSLQMGVGLQTTLYGHFDIRTEYTYADYTSFESEFGTIFSPSNSQFMVSLLYHFG